MSAAFLAASFVVPTLDAIIEKTKLVTDAISALDATESNVFGDHIAVAVQDGQSKENVEMHFKKFEALYKATTSAKSMPAPYRSAKSVISNAVELSISLLDDDGLPKGKSALQAEIKELKTGKTPEQKFREHVLSAIKNTDQEGFAMSKADYMSLMAELLAVCPE